LQSDPINPENLPDTVVRIIFEKEKIEPAEFKVEAGQAVSLSVTASSSMEVFKFESPLLSSVAVGLTKGETRVITFNAPTEKGEYTFYSDILSRKEITGKMIVE
jgi:plastocyanin